MKITHWGEDYAEIRIGSKDFIIDLVVAQALERYINRQKKVKKAIDEILDYMWLDEHKHWQEENRPKEHIYHDLKALKAFNK